MASEDDKFRADEKNISKLVRHLIQISDNPRKKTKKDELNIVKSKLNHLVDVDHCDCKKIILNHERSLTSHGQSLGISPSATLCQINGAPEGFYLFRNALILKAQYDLCKLALSSFPLTEHTNITNLRKIQSESSPSTSASAPSSSWKDCLDGLRWVSLGFHYDWTTRQYLPPELSHSSIPADFSCLCQELAAVCGLTLTPEAAIVNYYPLNGQMCGHLDDAEHNMDEPIVSISLGCDCIFLIGGRSKADPPVPLLLRGGDAVVMSGKSRYCYHGVPAIIPCHINLSQLIFPDKVPLLPHIATDDSAPDVCTVTDARHEGDDDADAPFIREYMRRNRVNMNTRRVTRADGRWENKNGSGYTPL